MIKYATRKETYQALTRLLDSITYGSTKYRNYGICDATLSIINSALGNTELKRPPLFKYWKTWKHYTGDDCFPIPDPQFHKTDYDDHIVIRKAENKFFDADDRYTGDYGKLRLDLLKYLLRQTR